jgi:hypothetical protein
MRGQWIRKNMQLCFRDEEGTGNNSETPGIFYILRTVELPMHEYHTVQQGEHLPGIASTCGWKDCRKIWNHPENADLKKRRKNPITCIRATVSSSRTAKPKW